MNWFYISGYVVVAAISARILYNAGFKVDYADSMKKGYGPEEKVIEFAKKYGFYFSCLGLVWPVAWPILLIVSFITRPTKIERDIEKRKAEESRKFAEKIEAEERERRITVDMKRIREWHEKNKMEAPDNMTLRLMAISRVDNNEDID